MNVTSLESERNNRDWVTIHYENIIIDPEKELRRIFNRWNKDIPDSVIAQARVPSRTTEEATFLKSVDEQLAKWRGLFSEEQIGRFEKILHYFGIKCYDVKHVLPITQLNMNDRCE